MSRLAHKPLKQILLYLPFLIVGIIGVYFIVGHDKPVQTKPTDVTDVVTRSLDNPSEVAISKETYISTATAGEPSRISLPSIGAEGLVQKVGIDQHQAVAAPTNVHLAGWYVNSLKPGDAGLSVIDGHVDGRTERGIFYNLKKLKPNDIFTVTFGDGVEKQFVVKSLKQVSTADTPDALFAQDPSITNQLNLITCGGSFNQQTRTYDQRTIVVSALVP